MKTYPIPMVPGPVSVPPAVLEAYQYNYGSADLESEYLQLYADTESGLKTIMKTENRMAILSGEGMLALWAALKSCLVPGDRVLSVGTGLFGEGIGDMAATVGAEVKKVSLPFNETISDLSEVEDLIRSFSPKMITAVHCETPSGTLNPLSGLGDLKNRMGVPLFYVDAVSSIGGAEVRTDAWHIDLCLGGSQKCLSSLPDTAFLSVSEAAWEIIETVDYQGYSALKPFKTALADAYFPYTPNWHALAGLKAGADIILDEGLPVCIERHADVSRFCRQRIADLGLKLYPAKDAVSSPTVTAVCMPDGISWNAFDKKFREKGLVVGGNYGPLDGKVFRLGHMGSQADRALVEKALSVIAQSV